LLHSFVTHGLKILALLTARSVNLRTNVSGFSSPIRVCNPDSPDPHAVWEAIQSITISVVDKAT
jgi:hypothetical protein